MKLQTHHPSTDLSHVPVVPAGPGTQARHAGCNHEAAVISGRRSVKLLRGLHVAVH